MKRQTAIGAMAGILILALVVSPTPGATEPTPSVPADGLAGLYYFKGPRLMGIDVEGDTVHARLFGPGKEEAAGEPSPFPESWLQRRGRLLSPDCVEFDNWPFERDELARRLASEDASEAPVATEQVEGFLRQFKASDGATYFERWRLLPEGRLQMECALPIRVPGDARLDPLLGREAPGRAPSSEIGEYQRVCGWKVTDKREAEGWSRLDADQYAEAAEAFAAAAAAQPDRPFAWLGEAWARAGLRQFDRARAAWQAGVERLNDETRPFLEPFTLFLKDQIDSCETVTAGKDFLAFLDGLEEAIPIIQDRSLGATAARDLTDQQRGKIASLVESLRFWPQIEQAGALRGRGPLTPAGQRAFWIETHAKIPLPNFLKGQTLAKLLLLRGHLARTAGEQHYPAALNNYAMAVAMGQAMRHGFQIAHMIGVAMEMFGLDGLEQMVADGLIAQEGTAQSLVQIAGALCKSEPEATWEEMDAYDDGLGYVFTVDTLRDTFLRVGLGPDLSGVLTRARHARTRLVLLRAAADLKRRLPRGPYPETLDAASLPEDPFAPDRHIRYVGQGSRACFFSLGPAQRELATPASYDPTNGTVSAGYIAQQVR